MITLDELDSKLALYQIQLVEYIAIVTDIQDSHNRKNNLYSTLFTILSFWIAFFQLFNLYQASLISKSMFVLIMIILIAILSYFILQRRGISRKESELESKLDNIINEMKMKNPYDLSLTGSR